MSVQEQKKALAQNIIRNISEYDAGLGEALLRENKRKNISVNLKSPAVLKEVAETFGNATDGFDASQKMIFTALNNYYIRQETGLRLAPPLTEDQKNNLVRALGTLALVDSPRLAQTLTNSFLYSESMTHYNFGQNRAFSKEDLSRRLPTVAPKANMFGPRPDVLRKREIENERIRDPEMVRKPREITHQLGR